ncbi:recombinase family protein [Streptosporangium canum]|uniref:recombinase family protein n=1 Tax=Streptosporangium canum TaxID=324952 RepID=UPI003790F5FF
MLFGYARVSTADQNPGHQIDALIRAGVAREHIHLDKASGAKSPRPRLDLVLQLLREGDTLKVTRLDRLSRSVLHLVTLGADLRTRKIGLHVTSRASTEKSR